MHKCARRTRHARGAVAGRLGQETRNLRLVARALVAFAPSSSTDSKVNSIPFAFPNVLMRSQTDLLRIVRNRPYPSHVSSGFISLRPSIVVASMATTNPALNRRNACSVATGSRLSLYRSFRWMPNSIYDKTRRTSSQSRFMAAPLPSELETQRASLLLRPTVTRPPEMARRS